MAECVRRRSVDIPVLLSVHLDPRNLTQSGRPEDLPYDSKQMRRRWKFAQRRFRMTIQTTGVATIIKMNQIIGALTTPSRLFERPHLNIASDHGVSRTQSGRPEGLPYDSKQTTDPSAGLPHDSTQTAGVSVLS